MAFSFLTQELAVDLGTANTVILMNDKVVIDEPSIVAFDQKSGRIMAVGETARQMYEKTNQNIRTVRPLKDGVIADFDAAEQMIRGFVKMINSRRRLFTPSLKMVVCIPSGSTEVERRAVRDSSEHVGSKEVYIIFEPMAAALGIGIDVMQPFGNMIVDIGGGTAEIAVISLGGIVCSDSIRVAGDVFTADIQQYMRQQHNLRVGERSAEQIKINVGAATADLDQTSEPYIVKGPNIMTSRPIEVAVTSQEIAHCLNKSIEKIEAAILNVLEQTPPELYSDIVNKGICLTGGGALLKGLDKRLTEKFNIQFHVAENPLKAVARGTSIALKNLDYPFLMR